MGKFSDYELLSVIGKGSAGIVYKALHIKQNKIYAIKEVKMADDLSKEHWQYCLREVEIMKSVHHENII